VHNHPYYATLLATMGESPRLVHQNSCIFDGELAFVDEYAGSTRRRRQVARARSRRRERRAPRASRCDRHRADDTIACYKAVTFERMCRFTYDTLAAGREPVELTVDARASLKRRCCKTRRTHTGTARSATASRPARGADMTSGMSLDDLQKNEHFGGGKDDANRSRGFQNPSRVSACTR
jgi:hypothetical protein